jgi:hypothetical protein
MPPLPSATSDGALQKGRLTSLGLSQQQGYFSDHLSYLLMPKSDSLQFGWICYPSSAGFPFDGHSEDCLFANVWAPDGANSSSKLPVWVFIQGGGTFSLPDM